MEQFKELSDIPPYYKNNPTVWWNHVDSCSDCMRYYATPSSPIYEELKNETGIDPAQVSRLLRKVNNEKLQQNVELVDVA